MKYFEKIVKHQQLKDHVLCYWNMNGSIPSSNSINSRYVPKGQSLLIFNYGNKINLPNKEINTLFFIVPMISSSLVINQTGKIDLFGISFIGDGLYKLVGQPIQNVDQPLPEKLFAKLQNLYSELQDVSFEQKCSSIESFLVDNLNQSRHNETFHRAVQLINKSRGKIKISDLSEQLNVSPRQLQRQFKIRLGLTPKNYCKVIRVNHYLSYILENPDSVDWMDLVVEFNYHDQPHLINEVKTIAKLSPQKLLHYKDTLYHLYTVQ